MAEPTYSFRDPRQRRIYERLRLVGPGPATFFFDACRLMEESSSTAADAASSSATQPQRASDERLTLSSTTHLVGHLLRDIESALTDVLTPSDFRKRQGNDGHRQSIRAALKSLGINENELVARAWLDLPSSEFALHRVAHRRALEPPRRADADFLAFWDRMQMILDLVLDKFEANYLNTNKTLDALLAKGVPTAMDAETLRNRTPNHFVSRRRTIQTFSRTLREAGLAPGAPNLLTNSRKCPSKNCANSLWLGSLKEAGEAHHLKG